MAKNRIIPFGYRIEDGQILIHPEEQKAVVYIFSEYLKGRPMSEIASEIQVPYKENMPWYDSIIWRIMTNQAYCGKRAYPSIITEEMFSKATEIRMSKGYTTHRIPAEIADIRYMTYCKECRRILFRIAYRPAYTKWDCHTKACSKFSFRLRDSELFTAILDILNIVIANPDLINRDIPEKSYSPNQEIIRQQNEIRRMMENPTVNYEHIKSKIYQLAEMKYTCCEYNDISQKTEELKSLLLQTEKQNILDVGLLKSCVRRILVSHSCTIEIEFINGAIINERGEKT